MNKSSELLGIVAGKESGPEVNESVHDDVGRFWVVTTAGDSSEEIDILFQSDVPSMVNQGAGGLTIKDLVMVTKDHNKALKEAAIQLEKRLRA
jgi:hypothetical protein